MATFTWTLQGGTPTVIAATDTLQFAGAAGFDSNIAVGSFNDTMHVKTSGAANKSSGNTPRNNKFISQSGGAGGDSQVDVGSGTVNLDTVTTGQAALLVNFSDPASVAITNAIIYGYDGVTTTAVPTGVTLKLAEVGDTNFVDAEGSAAALALADQAAATSHNYYIVASVSPDSVGLKDAFALRMELTYS